VLGQCALARRLDGPFASLMEKIMSKTSNATRERELTEAELDQVAGGTPSIPIPPPTSYAIGRLEPQGFPGALLGGMVRPI
jgi:hypothetical protein